MSNRRPTPRRWFGGLTLLTISLAVVIGAVLLNAVDGDGLDRLKHDVGEAAPLLSLLRLVVIVGVVLTWPSLLRFCQRRDWIAAATQQQLLARRTRLALWLIGLELILGFDVLNRLDALLEWLGP